MPGVLMNWINDHSGKKSEHLFKVLTILSYFAKTEEGLVLLKEYESIQFLEGLRVYVLKCHSNPEAEVQIIEEIVRKLVPLGRNLAKTVHTQVEDQLSQQNNEPNSKSSIESIASKPTKRNPQTLILKFEIPKSPLGQSQQKNLFDLLVQLKYSKKQLQYQTLMSLFKLLKHHKKRYFRCKSQLIQELITYIEVDCYPWLACELLNLLFEGLIQNSNSDSNYKVIDGLENGKIRDKEKVLVEVQVKIRDGQTTSNGTLGLFGSVYAGEILSMLASNAKKEWIPGLLSIKFNHGYRHFLKILKKVPKEQLQSHQVLLALNFYGKKFPQCNEHLSPYVKSPDKVPPFRDYQMKDKVKLTYFSYLRNFLPDDSIIPSQPRQQQSCEGFKISQNLHRISQLIQTLQKGTIGISYDPAGSIHLYFQTLLLLIVAVSKQDPLMSYYPKCKVMLEQLSVHRDEKVRIEFYAQLLKNLNSHQKLLYVSKNYLRNQLMERVLTGDQPFFNEVFRNSFYQEDSLYYMLQVVKGLQGKINQNFIAKYVTIFYSLVYYKQTQGIGSVSEEKPSAHKIASLSNLILSRLSKKAQFKTLLLQFFSKDPQLRKNMFKQILNEQEDILQPLIQEHKASNLNTQKKRLLKVSQSTILNFVNVGMNPDLEIEIRISALQDLIETLQRAQINQNLIDRLQELQEVLSKTLKKSVGQFFQQNNTKSRQKIELFSIQIELYALLHQKLLSAGNSCSFNQSSIFQEDILLGLLNTSIRQKTKNKVLKMLYFSVYRSPFTPEPKKHWVMNYFPHHQIDYNLLQLQHPIPSTFKQVPTIPNHNLSDQSETNQSKNFKDYTEGILKEVLRYNQPIINLNISILQVQINSFIGNRTQNYSLNLIAYLLNKLNCQTLQSQYTTIITPLLNNIVSNDNNWYENDTVRIISALKIKRNRQIDSIIANQGRKMQTRLLLLNGIMGSGEIAKTEQVDSLLKGSKHCSPDELVLVYRILLNSLFSGDSKSKKGTLRMQDVSGYAKLSLMGVISEQIQGGIQKCKQTADPILTHCSLYVLARILQVETDIDTLNLLMNTIVHTLTQGSIHVKDFILGLQCLKLIIPKLTLKQNATQTQSHLLRTILGKVLQLIKANLPTTTSTNLIKSPSQTNSHYCSHILLYATLISTFTNLLKYKLIQILQEVDIIDMVVSLLAGYDDNWMERIRKGQIVGEESCQRQTMKEMEFMMMVGQCWQFLTQWRIIQPQLSQYLLSSTNLLTYTFEVLNVILSIIKNNNKNRQDKVIQQHNKIITLTIQKVSILLHYITKQSSDLFVLKLNKLYKSNPNLIPNLNIFSFLAQFSIHAGLQFFKMYSWLIVVEWKGRTIFDQNYEGQSSQQTYLGSKVINTYIQKGHMFLTNSLIAMSTSAKKALLQSDTFLAFLKKISTVVDRRVVRNMRSKKQTFKGKQQQQQDANGEASEQYNQVKIAMLLLCSLFHSTPQLHNRFDLRTFQAKKQICKKLCSVVERLYAYCTSIDLEIDPQQNSQIQNLMVKMLTNLAQSSLFGPILSAHFSFSSSENSSFMLEDLCSNVLKNDYFINPTSTSNNSLKKSLILLGVLSQHQTVRNMIFRMKIVQELSGRMTRYIQDPRKDNKSFVEPKILQNLHHIFTFYLNLSQHKDSNIKILTDKKIMEILIFILSQDKYSFLEEKVLQLLQNLSCFKQNKAAFVTNKQIHKIFLWKLQEITHKDHSGSGDISSHTEVGKIETILTIIYNFIYKSSAMLKIYRKKQVIAVLERAKQQHQKNLDNPDKRIQNNGLSKSIQFQEIYNSLLEALEESI